MRHALHARHAPYDQSCDVYSFGILLWEVLHQETPFGDLNPINACITAITGGRPPIHLDEDRGAFVSLITDCWSQCPAHRPAMATVVQELLRIEGSFSSCPTKLADISLGDAIGPHQWPKPKGMLGAHGMGMNDSCNAQHHTTKLGDATFASCLGARTAADERLAQQSAGHSKAVKAGEDSSVRVSQSLAEAPEAAGGAFHV